MRNCIITVTDENYLEQTQYLIGAVRKYGKWKGDFLVIPNGLSFPDGFVNSAIIPFTVMQNYNWAKINIFHNDILSKYDRVLYLDQDCIINLPIQPIFEQSGDFLSDDDTKLVRGDFREEIEDGHPANDFIALQQECNVDAEAFCSGIMRFDTKIIPKDFIKKITALREKYKYINNLNNIPGGMAEQSILNIWFCEKWQQFERACFVGRKKENTILTHHTSWYAPWKTNRKYYEECLKYYREAL
jgi:hypothetical protein